MSLGGKFEDINFDFASAIEVANDDISKFGNGAGADIAFDTIFVFVHKEESISLIEVLVETLVNVGEVLCVVGISRLEPTSKGKSR